MSSSNARRPSRSSEVIVATDDTRIWEVAQEFLPRGNDRARIIPAARTASPKWRKNCPCDGVINIQGDEPLIDPRVIDAVAGALDEAEMSTAATPIERSGRVGEPKCCKSRCQRRGPGVIFFPAHDSVCPRRRHGRSTNWRRFRF